MKLYLVKMVGNDTNEIFYKIGITNQPDTLLRFTSHGEPWQIASLDDFEGKEKVTELSRRLAGHIYTPTYEIEILHEVTFETNEEAAAAERDLLKTVRETSAYAPRKHFSGATECFHADPERVQIVIEMMDCLVTDHAKTD